MIQFLKNLLGMESTDIGELIAKGAQIIDVRTTGEYQRGHLKNSVNIPLDTLKNNLGKLDNTKPIITCCASGMRSGSARSFLKANGFADVYNGGSWTSLKAFTK